MKTIVTHFSVDLDAVTSCWLIRRFYPGWDKAEIKFVPAGSTLNNQPPDKDRNVIHIDTGLGKFDHHQYHEYLSSAKILFKFLKTKDFIAKKNLEPLERIIDYVNNIDNFGEVNFIDPAGDIYDFSLHQIIEGLKSKIQNDYEVILLGSTILDGIMQIFKNKVRAEEEIKKGLVFQSKWGKGLALESKNEESLKLALKMGFSLAVRKDPEKNFLRIKTLPKKDLNLTPLYNKLKIIDNKATWYLHSSGNILLNGSSKNPNTIASRLSLKKVIEIIKNIKYN